MSDLELVAFKQLDALVEVLATYNAAEELSLEAEGTPYATLKLAIKSLIRRVWGAEYVGPVYEFTVFEGLAAREALRDVRACLRWAEGSIQFWETLSE